MMGMDIKEFLVARIAEDEREANEAKDATGVEWAAHGSLLMYVDDSESRLAEVVGAVEDYRMDPAWKHVERHDPTRVLAECAAKRAIIAAHDPSGLRWVGFPRAERQEAYCIEDQHAAPCDTLRTVATIYSDHPDYRPEWSPESTQD